MFIFDNLNITKEDFEKEYNFIIYNPKCGDSESQKIFSFSLIKRKSENRITIYHIFDNPM